MAITDRTLIGGKSVPGQRTGAPVGAEDETPAKAGKKKLVGVAVLVVALLGAGGGGYLLLGGGETAEAAETAEAEAEHVPGAVVPLEAITINLADGRYLQVGIALQEELAEAGGHGAAEPVDGSQALDILIATLSGRQMSELASPEQREAIKAELVAKIYEAYHHHVYDIYFTSFVMQ